MPRLDAFVRGTDLPPRGGFAFPTAATTGVRVGVSLTTETASTVSAGTYEGKHFVNGLNLEGVSNVHFIDCKVTGSVNMYYTAASNRTFSYCEIDADLSGSSAIINGRVFDMDHCKLHGGAQGIYGGVGLYEYNWISDMCIAGETHGECLLVHGDDSEFRYNSFIAKYAPGGDQTTPGGGFSACAVNYNHLPTWDGRHDVWVHHNLFQLDAVGSYTVYWGTPGGSDPMVNCVFEDNTFRKVPGSATSNQGGTADIVRDTGFSGGSGNFIRRNYYEDAPSTLVAGSD